jgi:hypothetical protein
MLDIAGQIVAFVERVPGQPDFRLTKSLWARMQARRAELGRELRSEEVSALVVADDGDDRDA